MLSRGYKAPQILQGQLLSFISLPVYMRASLYGMIGVRGTFEVTAKGGSKRVPLVRLWPQIGIWAVCIAAIAWGCNRLVYEPTAAIMVNIFWTLYHALLMSSIFYFNDAD
jgi:cellulose synthase (UDP-forming)